MLKALKSSNQPSLDKKISVAEWEMSREMRSNLKRLWQELEQMMIPKEFVNLEGGGIEQHYDRRLRFHHSANYAAVMTILARERRPLRLLELGCGTGALSFAFARIMPPLWTLYATDYSKYLIDYARRNHRSPNLMFECLNINDLCPSFLNEFDVVMMLEVIEHLNLKEVQTLFPQLNKGLKPGAMVVISTLDRSPYPRRFSGYYPHKVEYCFRTFTELLRTRKVNPFSDFRVFRLLSKSLVSEAVRTEERGGYIINRLAGLLMRSIFKSGGMPYYQKRLLGSVSRFYGVLRRARNQKPFPVYLNDTYLVEKDDVSYNQESFSLIALLRRK